MAEEVGCEWLADTEVGNTHAESASLAAERGLDEVLEGALCRYASIMSSDPLDALIQRHGHQQEEHREHVESKQCALFRPRSCCEAALVSPLLAVKCGAVKPARVLDLVSLTGICQAK